MNSKLFLIVALAALTTLPTFAQSKEQREAARQWPITLRVKVGKEDSKQSKIRPQNGIGPEKTVIEKIKRWTAEVDIRQTNMPEKVELRSFYIGQRNGEMAILGKDVAPVEFNAKGHAVIEITSPTCTITKAAKGGNRRGIGIGNMGNQNKQSDTGDRLEGLAAQLVVDGTIIKTFVSKPIWANGAWEESPDEDAFNPMKRNKKL